MARETYRRIIELVKHAARLARDAGIPNLLQPGLVKEMILADLLGHELIVSKRDADAREPDDPGALYEYLTCKEGGTGQLDRMFKIPPSKRAESLKRISRNRKIFFAVFYEADQLEVKAIYELEPETVMRETLRQLKKSVNNISHVGFSESWVRKNARIVYENPMRA